MRDPAWAANGYDMSSFGYYGFVQMQPPRAAQGGADMRHVIPATVLAALVFSTTPAPAQIKIGVIVSLTGPAASLGIPERNAVALAPSTMHGERVEYIVLDDASDSTTARRSMARLVSSDKVDLVIGSSTSPASLSLIEIAGRSGTPLISLGASRALVFPIDENRRWVFKTPYNDATTAAATIRHMKQNKVQNVATMSVSDAYGEGWLREFRPVAEREGLRIVATEQYGVKDTSAAGQTLKIMATRPDAVLVIAYGTSGALPQITLDEHGYRQKVYQTTGIVNADFLRVGQKAVEGTLIAANPLSVAANLPDGHVAKVAALAFTKSYDAAYGLGSTSAFSGYAHDALLIAEAAVPRAMKTAVPGTAAFRTALREAIESLRDIATTAGPITMSPEDHNGYAADAPFMVQVVDGKFMPAR